MSEQGSRIALLFERKLDTPVAAVGINSSNECILAGPC